MQKRSTPELGLSQPQSRVQTRHDRRKARTRAQIVDAANQLFAERGYLETSVEDISELADVAVRTVYTHFPSKAAILLDYFDRWLDALIEGLLAQPVELPIAEALTEALARMKSDGWVDRSYDNIAGSPPSALGLIAGPPEVAGYMMHSWSEAQARLVTDAFDRGHYSAGSLEPQARATAVFAACMAPMFTARLSLDGEPLPRGATANGLIGEFVFRLTRGRL
ncbi:MAG: TetR/AcrR family transcriptional regulator [Actinobacteria bacterium]|nr:TetR/AcrR family transcriptional regulator [Actinomycetota bacterium]